MKVSALVAFSLFFFWASDAGAQWDSTRVLPRATIRDARFDQTGFSIWRADSLPQTGVASLSERLLWENPVAVRPNGPGTLATVSVRGAGPSRTPVFWNGLNLQSPQNGTVDASLLPLWPGDRLEVRYGGQSAAQSSGAMGGAILVEPAASFPESGFSGSLSGALGSFGRRDAGAELDYAKRGSSAQARAAWQKADNDFPFTNTARIGSPEVRQTNNRLEKLDIQQFNRLVINEKNMLKTAVWHQRAFREIPPAMTEKPSETWQRDRATRAVASWDHSRGARSLWQARAAFTDEAIYFRYAGDTDSSRARTAFAGAEFSSTAGPRLNWKAGGGATRQWARAEGYADSTRWFGQTRLAGFAMAEWTWRGGMITALLRQESVNGKAVPFTWSAGGQVGGGKAGALRFHLSRNFNLPTFNDRFWRAYGKENLKPEKGYSADAGWIFKRKAFSSELSVFQLLVDDWILWQPDSNGIFKPDNLRKVWSRGVETAVHWEMTRGAWKWKISGRYQYAKATNVAVYDGLELVLHRQLLYTPRHNAGIALRMERGRLSGAYLHQWTGKRYTTTDNSASLPGFSVGNLLLGYAFLPRRVTSHPGNAAGGGKWTVAVDLRVENVWNKPCQVIAFRPMPGRNWRLGFVFGW